MIVASDGQLFGVPMEHVVETVRIPRSSIRWIKQSMTAILRVRIVPLKALNQLLGVTSVPRANEDDELANVLLRRNAISDEMEDSRLYIDVMRDHIGDSLAESEREVLKVIEQISVLNEKSNRQRDLIAETIENSKDMMESTQSRVEANKGIVSAIGLRRAMGHIQFQDVMRQRMEQVQKALVEMRDHMQRLSETRLDSSWMGQLDITFKTLLAAHLDTYSMASQTETHNSADGGVAATRNDCPAFELF